MSNEDNLRVSPEVLNLNPNINRPWLWPALSVCSPRILVVTDMNFDVDVNEGFSLSEFVKSLESGLVKGVTPVVDKAVLAADTFSNATNGLNISRYDVCFIFAFGSRPEISGDELDAIINFMESGGGLFATGDHDELGAVCRDIPRVRSMRKWTNSQGVPSAGGVDRLSTNLPGDDYAYEFADQSDVYPQRLYLNWRTIAGGIGLPHPVMQLAGNRAVDYIADHPHEGECLIPNTLTTTFSLNGVTKDEWPEDLNGNRVSPEIVAKSMSHGNGFSSPSKRPVTPREFISIAAYDGHEAKVGRVVTDATWHHFINININGAGSSREGLMPNGIDTPELVDIRQHWVNLADWLMPKIRTRCWPVVFILEFAQYPIREEFILPLTDRPAGFERFIGKQFKDAFSQKMLPYQVQELLDNALEIGLNDDKLLNNLVTHESSCSQSIKDELAEVALGTQAIALFELIHNGSINKFKKLEPLLETVEKATISGVQKNIGTIQERMESEMSLLQKLSKIN